jgi:O-antigen/teichoic acid export membrane protein
LDPGHENENLKGPAETTPPPVTPANTGDTGAVGHTYQPAADTVTPSGNDPAEIPGADQATPTPPKQTVKALAMRGSAWAMGGNLTQQFIRLASNLLLTRLLLPEAFGLMTIVNVVLIGLQMFSDIGIGPSIIQHKRGEDPAFYNTAWTIQIIRGFVLTLAAVCIVTPAVYLIGSLMASDAPGSAQPVYADPLLIPLICVGSLTALISGFNSTRLFTVNRKMVIGRLTVLEVGVQVMGVVAMASWAWYYQSVWALVGGGLVQSWLKMLLSHTILPGENNRLHFEREAFDDLIRFGRWIFLSTAALFVAAQGDRLLLGFYISKTVLGVYSIAYFLSEALAQMIEFVSRRVFLPAFSHVARDNPDRLRTNYYRVRLRLDALTLPAAGGLMILGSDVVNLLYPDKYAAAGWMLEILAIRVALACTLPAAVSCLLAIGDSKSVFAGNLGKTVALLTGIPLGWHLGGLQGVIWAIALSELGSLPILWWRMARHGLLSPAREALAVSFVALGIGAGWLVSCLLAWL